MIEPIIVGAPIHYPQQCVCGSQKRPIADTGLELPGNVRLYVCVDCAKMLARAYGFVEGPELDKLMDASHEIALIREEIETARERQIDQENEIRRLSTEKALVEEERDLAEGKAAQLQHIAEAIEAASHEMTSGAPA